MSRDIDSDDFYDYSEDDLTDMEIYHARNSDSQKIRRSGDPRNEILFTTSSLKTWALMKFFTNNMRQIKIFFGLIFLVLIVYLISGWFDDGNSNQFIELINVLAGEFLGLVYIIATFIFKVFFVYNISKLFIWSIVITRIFYSWLISKEYDIFAVIELVGKTLNIQIYRRLQDEKNHPYLVAKSSFFYKFLNGGPPRIPFHPDMIRPFVDFMEVNVEMVEDGWGAETIYKGFGIAVFSNKSADGSKVQEGAVLHYVDVEENDGVYKYAYIDMDRIVPVTVWQSIFAGMDLEYWKEWQKEKKANALLARELTMVKFDSGIQYQSQQYPTDEELLIQYTEEEIIDADEYRTWDDIKKQLNFVTSGGRKSQ